MAVFRDHVEDAETINNPAQGTITVTGDFASFTGETNPTLDPPTVVSYSSAVSPGAAVSIVCDKPSGFEALAHPDYLIAMVAYDSGVIGSVAPNNAGLLTSWANFGGVAAGDNDVAVRMFYKLDLEGDTGPFEFDAVTGAGEFSVTITRLRAPYNFSFDFGDGADIGTGTSHSFFVPATFGPNIVRLIGVVSSNAVSMAVTETTEITEVADVHSAAWSSLATYFDTSQTGRTLHFTSSSSTHSIIWVFTLHTAQPSYVDHSGWVRIHLDAAGEFQFHTLGSAMVDTKMSIYDHAPTEGINNNGVGALYFNDDVGFSPWWDEPDEWYHSFIPEAGGTIVLPAGDYWIVVWPYDRDAWNTSEGPATLSIVRIDDPDAGGPDPTETRVPVDIVIKIGGVDVTDVVRYRDASFVSQVNGSTGPCFLAIRDTDHTRGFTFGQEITLDIDGIRQWTGFLVRSRRSYSFPVVDTTTPSTVARWFLIEGFDINWLFQKRVVRRMTSPEKGSLPAPVEYRDPIHADQWVGNSPSDVIVSYVFEHYTDLAADGITLGEVLNIGSPNPDSAAAFTGGVMFGDFMRLLNKLLNGVYCFTADREFIFRDTETATTPYFLTDRPRGNANAVGPRDYSFTTDATKMVNDAMIWGTAAGVPTVRFGRVQDASSQALHGLWQYGEFNQSLYKQASVNHRADSIVNGNSPTRHGAKDDIVAVTATVYAPIFSLADVVSCRSKVFNGPAIAPFQGAGTTVSELRINLPVRRISITFPTPNHAKFVMLLSQELDDPWSMYEFVFPKIQFTPITTEGPPVIGLPPHIQITDRCMTSILNERPFNGDGGAGPFVAEGPQVGGGSHIGGGWVLGTPRITGSLNFPGVDYDIGGGNHVNRLSPIFSDASVVKMRLDSLAFGGGPAASEWGISGSGGSIYFGSLKTPVVGVDLEIDALGDDNVYVGMAFGSGLPYSSTVTGSGTYSYVPGSFGKSSDLLTMTSTQMTARINASEFGAYMPYTGAASWNKDVVIGRLRVSFSAIATSGTPQACRLTYGPATVTLTPSTASGGGITAATSVDSGSFAYTGWLAATEYSVQFAVNLPADQVIVTVYEGSTLVTTMTLTTGGERVGDATYQPEVRFYITNTAAVDWAVSVKQLEGRLYYRPPTGDLEFQGSVEPTPDGWGPPWVVYASGNITPEPDPGTAFSVEGGYGRISVADEDVYQFPMIRKPANGGAQELRFSVSEYPVGLSEVLYVVLVVSGSFSWRDHVVLGSSMWLQVGSGGHGFDGSAFFDGTPVNVIIRWSQPDMAVTLWKFGDPEPTEPTFIQTGARYNGTDAQNIIGFMFGGYNNGHTILIGPIDGDNGGAAVFFEAPVTLVNLQTMYDVTGTLTTTNFGRSKSWPFSDPGDGRSYAVAWGGDSYGAGNPSAAHRFGMVWGLFGNLGPGAELEATQGIRCVKLPKYSINGVPAEFDVIFRGEVGLTIEGGSSGSGTATLTAAVRTFNYGPISGPTPPSVSDYFIGGGGDEVLVTSNLVQRGGTQWTPFAVKCSNSGSNGGISYDGSGNPYFTYGVELKDDIFQKLRDAGPFDQNGFLTPNWGFMSAGMRNLTFEVVPRGTPVIGTTDPCAPTSFTQGTPDSGGTGETYGGGGTVFHTSGAFVQGSALVYIDGDLLPFSEYTQDGLHGLITLDTTIPEGTSIRITYEALGVPEDA